MPLAPRPDRRIETLRAPRDLSEHEGEWVGTRGSKIVAVAPTARELAVKLRSMGDEGRNVTAQYVAPPAEGYRVGVG